MADVKRNLEPYLLRDLEKKFVFLSGPRQVGKTTLAGRLIEGKGGRYYSYDDADDREKILKKAFVRDSWVCLDELHKYERWKSLIKGVHDKYHRSIHLLLTGSARLDVYQKSGDSLLGRYYLHHLHPLSVGELRGDKITLPGNMYELQSPAQEAEGLFRFGGFPEPFLAQSEEEHRRWSAVRRTLLVREELRDMTQIKLLGVAEQLLLLLPERVGSLFSYRSLAEILRVSVPTIQAWLEAFERLFIVFKIRPYSKRISRTLQKQPKYYFWDWSQVEEPAARYENFLASHLWKAAQVWSDLGLARAELYYVRDRDGREVDFLMTNEGKPWFLVEAKLAESRPDDTLSYFGSRLGVPALQLTWDSVQEKRQGFLSVADCRRWLPLLP